MLLPQKSHEAMVLFTGARGERGGAGASQGVVLLADWSSGNLSGRRQSQIRIETKGIRPPEMDVSKLV